MSGWRVVTAGYVRTWRRPANQSDRTICGSPPMRWRSIFRDAGACLDFAALSMSIVLDFFVKSTGTGHVNLSWLSRLPVLADTCDPRIRNALRIRALRPCCLTRHYADPWSEVCNRELPPPTAPEHPENVGDYAATDPGSTTIASPARSGNAVIVPDQLPTHGAGGTASTGEPPAGAVAATDRPSACSDAGIATMDEPSGRDAASSDSAPAMAESTSAIEAFRTDAWTRQAPACRTTSPPSPANGDGSTPSAPTTPAAKPSSRSTSSPPWPSA